MSVTYRGRGKKQDRIEAQIRITNWQKDKMTGRDRKRVRDEEIGARSDFIKLI